MWKPDAEHDGPVRVIVIEDGIAETSPLRRTLAAGDKVEVGYAATWGHVEKALKDGVYDVALIHGNIGEDTPFGVNARIRSLLPSPPATIMYGGQNNGQMVRKAFRLGFSDYIFSDGPLDEGIFRSIAYGATVARAARQRLEEQHRLERSAQRDALTGLPNRFFLEDRLAQLRALSDRRGSACLLLLLRIREIDEIVARFGFHTGEKVVYSCGSALRKTARVSDDFGRLDFNTFFYLLDAAIAKPDLDVLTQRLCDSAAVSVVLDELTVTVSVKAAMAQFPSGDVSPTEFVQSLQDRLGPGANAHSTVRHDEGTADAFDYTDGEAGAGLSAAPIDRNTNRRSSHRRRVFKRGAIVLNNGFSTVSCIIRDVSEGGARVVADGQFVAPDRFELLFVESGQRFLAQKRWQVHNQIGLQFLG